MISHERAEKIVDGLSDYQKKELVLMAKVRDMHEDGSIDTEELKMTLCVLMESTYSKLMLDPERIPAALRAKVKDIQGLVVDVKNDDMMAGFFGGMLAVLDTAGMPTIVTDEPFLHMLAHVIVAVKQRQLENRIKEKANGNKEQCKDSSAQGASGQTEGNAYSI